MGRETIMKKKSRSSTTTTTATPTTGSAAAGGMEGGGMAAATMAVGASIAGVRAPREARIVPKIPKISQVTKGRTQMYQKGVKDPLAPYMSANQMANVNLFGSRELGRPRPKSGTLKVKEQTLEFHPTPPRVECHVRR
jgi:hypothetical protein